MKPILILILATLSLCSCSTVVRVNQSNQTEMFKEISERGMRISNVIVTFDTSNVKHGVGRCECINGSCYRRNEHIFKIQSTKHSLRKVLSLSLPSYYVLLY
jgi:hypothetical protein